jgi:hypothetical protein
MTDEQQRKPVVEAKGGLPILSYSAFHGEDAIRLVFTDGQSCDFLAKGGPRRELAAGLLSNMPRKMRDDVIKHVTKAKG